MIGATQSCKYNDCCAMPIQIVSRSALSSDQVNHLTARAALHRGEPGPSNTWEWPAYAQNLYAILNENRIPIGIVYMVGSVGIPIDIGWWIDTDFRGRGYAGPAIDACAKLLKKRGATSVGHILILDTCRPRSAHLVERFLRHFTDG